MDETADPGLADVSGCGRRTREEETVLPVTQTDNTYRTLRELVMGFFADYFNHSK